MFVIDQEKLDSPDMKMLDIGNPPKKYVPHEEYPKMLYLHPKDKAKEHQTKVVNNAAERDAAMAQGWRQTPHIPVVGSVVILGDFEADIVESVPEKRGPGRPPKVSEAA